MPMPTPQEARRLFSQLVRLPDQEIDLVEAALPIAARQGSDGHMELCLAQLATLAHRVETLLKAQGITNPRQAPRETVRTINQVLFDEEGFAGNEEGYYEVE